MAPSVQQFWRRSKQWRQNNARIFLTSGSVSIVILLLRVLSLLEMFEFSAFDTLVRFHLPEPKDDRIRIVTVDQQDLNHYGYPLDDGLVADLIQKINAQHPAVVGLDIIRDRPTGKGHDKLTTTIKEMPNFVGIEVLNSDPKFYTPPLDVMRKPDSEGGMKRGVGFNNLLLDSDGVVRRNALYWNYDGITRRSFALQLAWLYLEDQKKIPSEGYPEANPKYLKFGPAIFYNLRDFYSFYGWIDKNENYQIISNMRQPESFDAVTLADVMKGNIPSDFFSDRIVLIGSVAENTKDFFLTPFSSKAQGQPGRLGGVEIHANFTSEILSAALDQRPLLKTFSFWQDVCWIFLWGTLGSAVIWRWRSPIRGALALIISGVCLTGGTYLLFTYGWLFPIVPSFLSLVGSAIVVTSYLAHQEKELSRSKEFFHSIIDTIPDPVFVKDANFQLMIVNDAFCQFIGGDAVNIIGKSDYDIFKTEEADTFRDQEATVLKTSQSLENEEAFTSLSGDAYTIATKRSLHKDVAGNLFLVGVIRDITERKKLEAELRRTADELTKSNDELKESEKRLRHLANHDPLTGLPNRKLFNEKLQQLLEWGEENKQLVSVLFLDLDGFKPVNDTLGHDIGDILLKAVSQRVKNCLRSSDVVSRLGGDEFTVLLPGVKQPLDSIIVAEKILQTVAAPYMLQGNRIQVTVSMGISVYPIDAESAGDLIKLADMAMYEAKRSGRNQYRMTAKLTKMESLSRLS